MGHFLRSDIVTQEWHKVVFHRNVLFDLYTNDCMSTYTNNYIMKYADVTVIISLLHKDMDLSSSHSEMDTLIQ